MSWKPEVIADSSGKWTGNGLRFATREEAEGNVSNLADRWFMVSETRVVESEDPVNYRWDPKQGLMEKGDTNANDHLDEAQQAV